MIGERVRHARAWHGWSQSQLAEMANVSQPAISQIEHGAVTAGGTLESIAQATGYSLAFFRRGLLPDLPQGSLRFRKRATSRIRDDERVRAHVRQAMEVIAQIVEVASPPPVRLRPVTTESLLDSDIETIAAGAREIIGVGPSDPIPNLTRAVERSGVVIIGSAFEAERHDGASFWPDFPTGRPIVSHARGLSGDRQRLTIAHEVGHLLLHTARPWVDVKQGEAEAFRFAGALLLPEQVAREEIERPVTLRSLAVVKSRHGVSIAAALRRCIDLHLIDSDRHLSLQKQISARGWRKNEPVHVPPEEPVLIKRLAEVAFGGAQPIRVAQAVGIPALAARDLLG